ncbi:MAG: hypothetical protein ACPG7F_00240 [Aggregatilineales bacterium]|mgnify:CR=1 FL=1
MKILIAGSRNATDAMLEYAQTIVEVAYNENYKCTIVCGDNPHGVDAAVVETATLYGIELQVYGIQPAPRNDTPAWSYHHLSAFSGTRKNQYYARDRWMCEQALVGYFIWNESSPGTKAGYDYMRKLGKTAVLVNRCGEIVERHEK